mmetsp:Transcript_118868/g.380838  ORF Transcript_118868/g.380838 Transcript_118868/m.380838 type:complete len:231 (-) Transcript_118868:96-788(-)
MHAGRRGFRAGPPGCQSLPRFGQRHGGERLVLHGRGTTEDARGWPGGREAPAGGGGSQAHVSDRIPACVAPWIFRGEWSRAAAAAAAEVAAASGPPAVAPASPAVASPAAAACPAAGDGGSGGAAASSSAPAEPSRAELVRTVFDALVPSGGSGGGVGEKEMWRFAVFTGFDGTASEWAEEFQMICKDAGGVSALDFPTFARLVDDGGDGGCFSETAELRSMAAQLTGRQ